MMITIQTKWEIKMKEFEIEYSVSGVVYCTVFANTKDEAFEQFSSNLMDECMDAMYWDDPNINITELKKYSMGSN
jgi:hypothetical protein